MKSTAILTPKEDLIVRYRVHGLQGKEIADRIHAKESTLQTHKKHIHAKLHVNNDVEVVVWYIENVLKINIKKLVQVGILLMLLVPSILMDQSSIVRAQRVLRTSRTRRADAGCESDYLLTV